MGHVGARNWLSADSRLSRTEAVELAAGLAWRGIGGVPIQDENRLDENRLDENRHDTPGDE